MSKCRLPHNCGRSESHCVEVQELTRENAALKAELAKAEKWRDHWKRLFDLPCPHEVKVEKTEELLKRLDCVRCAKEAEPIVRLCLGCFNLLKGNLAAKSREAEDYRKALESIKEFFNGRPDLPDTPYLLAQEALSKSKAVDTGEELRLLRELEQKERAYIDACIYGTGSADVRAKQDERNAVLLKLEVLRAGESL